MDIKKEKDKISGLIGLAARAGALTYGARSTREEFDRGKVKLIILTADCAARTKKETEFYAEDAVPVITAGIDGERAASLTGRGGKLSVIGVTDRNFASGMSGKKKEKKDIKDIKDKKDNEESINLGGENSGNNRKEV